MAPADYDKLYNTIETVYDPNSGRMRTQRATGEILERFVVTVECDCLWRVARAPAVPRLTGFVSHGRIVSKSEHRAICQTATHHIDPALMRK